MSLQELINMFNGHAERLPNDQIRAGKEIDLSELAEEIDAYRAIWEQNDPQTIDQLKGRERNQLRRALKLHARTLANMTFKIKVLKGKKQSVRNYLLRENPKHEATIKDIFNPTSWWLLFATVKDHAGNIYLDFCHVNTRKIARLKVSANAPIIDSFEVANPAAPRSMISITPVGDQEAPAC